MTLLLERRTRRLLVGLVGFRVLFSLFVLVRSSSHALPGLPRYSYDPFPGDGYGYYSAVRALLKVWQRDVGLLGPVAIAAVAIAVLVNRRSNGRGARLTGTMAAVWCVGIICAALAFEVPFTSAAQIGWPLVWSVPLLPYRILGLPLDPNIAFGVGLGLSLLANAVTVVATWALGWLATGRQRVALAAAALIAFWPILVLFDPAHRSFENGTWQIDLGLSVYTEPLSTALVISALALVLWRRGASWDAALAGGLLGLASLVRLSNGLIAGCAVLLLLIWRDRERAAAVCVAGLAFGPAVVLFWPKGYPMLKPPIYPAHAWEFRYASRAWSDSLLWHPSVLLILGPLAALGLLMFRRRAAMLLGSATAVTAILYSFYQLTPLHPRFLFVVVPIVLLGWADGIAFVFTRLERVYARLPR